MKLPAIRQMCIVILSMSFSCVTMAMPPAPKDCPTDTITLGNARVAAWRALRLDLDTLNHGDVHPALVYEWLDGASPLVLRHIAKHAMDPALVLAAMKRLVAQKAANVSLLRELSGKWAHNSRHPWFEALRVMGGDRKRILELEAELNARSDVIRVSAAATFAIAGNNNGKKVLLRQVATCGTLVRRAANVLGAIGTQSDQAAIEKSIAAGCRDEALRRASGEISFRKRYPEYYELLVRRDSSDTRYQAPDGMYASWFDIVRYAGNNGAISFSAFSSLLRGFRDFSAVWPHQSPEVSRRHVDALLGFLGAASVRIKNQRALAPWPKSWSGAMKNLADESRLGFGARVSATFAVLRWTNDIAEFNGAQVKNIGSILSPRGKRVSDDNWRSSWQGQNGASLVLEWSPVQKIDTLWLASGCSNTGGSGLKQIRIRVSGPSGHTSKKVTLNPRALFYQAIPIATKEVREMVIEIVETTDTGPACINELRATSF